MTDRSCLCIDHGLFPEIAACLAKEFSPCWYWTPWQSASPDSNQKKIGYGFPGVTRVEHAEMLVRPPKGSRGEVVTIDDVDLVCFLDVYRGPQQWREQQLDLERGGDRRFWGAGLGEELELMREATKLHMAEAGADIGPWEVVTGVDALREYLQKNPGCFVKTDTRGDFESFKSDAYDSETKTRVDRIERHLGPFAPTYPFVVEKKIENAVELGIDVYSVDGLLPMRGLTGLEIKDQAYIGHFTSELFWPGPVKRLHEAFLPTLKQYGYRGFFAVEGRTTKDGKCYLLEPSTRATSPCSELMTLMYTNLPQIIWEGAGGNLIDPVPAGKWGAQLCLNTGFFSEEWCPVSWPKEMDENVKLRNAVRVKGQYWVLPSPGANGRAVGAVVAVGGTMKEAVKRVKEVVEQVKAPGLEYSIEAFETADRELDKFADMGYRL